MKHPNQVCFFNYIYAFLNFRCYYILAKTSNITLLGVQ
jgi:hypothetical protein